MGRLSVRFCICCCLCLCLVRLAVPSSAGAFQFGTDLYGISGRVCDEQTQQAISRVEVTLREPGGVMREQVVTNESGRFDFGSINHGSYEITASAAGYESASTSVAVGRGSARGMTIYLKRTKQSEEAASGSTVSAHELSMPKKARDLVYSGKQKIFYGKNLQGGLEDLEAAVAVAPDYYEAYYQIGMTYLQLSKRDEAEKNFRKSIELSKDKYGEAVIGMGTILVDKADNGGGEKMIRHGLELSPNFWLGYYELGRACLAENHVADAKKAGEQARSLMPGAAIVYRLLANVHIREKDYPALLEDIDTFLKLEPDSASSTQAKAMRAQVVQKIHDEKIVTANTAPQ